MVNGKQITFLADRLASYTKACGKSSILKCKPKNLSRIDFSKVRLASPIEHTPKGCANTGIKNRTNLNRKLPNITVERAANSVMLKDKTGELLGDVMYDGLREVNGKKFLHFEGLASYQSGKGVGTKLIEELVEISRELGAEGRLIASASPYRSPRGQLPAKMTNLGFYYKVGFRATDPQKHEEILKYIKANEEIPLSLNIFTDITFIPKK